MNDQTTTTEIAPPVVSVRAAVRPEPDLLSTRQKNRGATRAKLVLVLVVLIAAAGAVADWYFTKDVATTDDAYTDGHAITVAPQVAGTVVSLDVNDNQRVKAGDLLFQIDPRAYVAARDQAQGSLQQAEAQLADARIAWSPHGATYPARLAAAQAQLTAAKATRSRPTPMPAGNGDCRSRPRCNRTSTMRRPRCVLPSQVDAAQAARAAGGSGAAIRRPGRSQGTPVGGAGGAGPRAA